MEEDDYIGAEEEEEVVENVDVVQIEIPKRMIIIKPENRMTSNIMTEYEQAEYVSQRAAQISEDGYCFVDITGLDDPIKMAERELMARRCPLLITRYVGEKDGASYYEEWNPAEMEFSVIYQ